MSINLTRRTALGLLAAPAIIGRAQAAGRLLRISHQFPSSTGDSGDFRDRMCQRFAKLVQERTGSSLEFQVYPNASLAKTFAQISGLRKGALDIALVPLTYAGGEIHEMNITFMPALVTSYAQGYNWRTAPVGRELVGLLEQRGIVLVSWMWQSGGMASRTQPLMEPSDARGMKIRGGSREMDEMFKAAGASVSSMPSNEVYIGMQTGVMDAACTSSSSFLSFKLQEACKHLAAPGRRSFFFILEPIMVSKAVWDTLSRPEQEAMMAVGEEMVPFNLAGAQADDLELTRTYAAAGVQVRAMGEETVARWQAVARESAWKGYAEKTALAGRMLK
ncbi:MAG: TRAP transporter substrate-binding protein DctP, partial [Janthinobacterium lividum]